MTSRCTTAWKVQLSYLIAEQLDLVGSFVEAIDGDGTTRYTVSNIPTSCEGVARALRFNNCVPHPTWLGKKELFLQGYRPIPQF